MSAYSIHANNISQHTPKLAKGPIRIYATVPIYWVVGENPIAKPEGCAMLAAGKSIELRLPVRCSSVAVLAVNEPGAVTITETSGGASSSCSI